MELTVVVINNYFEMSENPEISELMGKIWSVKRDGYKRLHSGERGTYMPLGDDDYYGTNVAICVKETMEPLIVFKVTSFAQSLDYSNVHFPYYHHLSEGFSELESHRARRLVDSYLKKGLGVSYSGGWCENLKLRKRELRDFYKELYTAIHFLYHKENNLQLMTCVGIKSTTTYDFFSNQWNCKDVLKRDLRLDSCDHVVTRLMYIDQTDYSEYTKKCMQKWTKLWSDRIEYGIPAKEKVANIA